MNKKIIFLLYNPLDERNYKRFGFETLEKSGWDVGCWIFFGKRSAHEPPVGGHCPQSSAHDFPVGGHFRGRSPMTSP